MGIRCYAFDKHWIVFLSMWHLPRLSQGRTQGRPKCAKNVLKWRTFELTGWITGKRLKIEGYMLRCIWQALNSLFIHVNLPRLSQGRTQGRPKCALGWLQKLTHVPLAIAILLVLYDIEKSVAFCLHCPSAFMFYILGIFHSAAVHCYVYSVAYKKFSSIYQSCDIG